jgi:hypothetical protein
MIRLSIAAAALALAAATNPVSAQTWGSYGYNSYGSYNSYSRPTYNSYNSYSYDGGRRYGYSRYGYGAQRCSYRCY